METQNSYRFTPLFYGLGQAFFWSSTAIVSGYAAVYLSGIGVSDSLIGVIVALTTVTSIVIQLIISDYLDKHPKSLSKTPVITLSLMSFISILIMVIFPQAAELTVILYTLALTFEKSVSSMLINVSVKSDIHIPFAIPRMAGSAAYATTCLLLGRLVDNAGVSAIMYVYIPVCALSAVVMILMHEDHIYSPPPAKKSADSSYFSILKSNKILRNFVLSGVFIGTGQSTCMTFLIRIVEECGGSGTELGTAMFIQSMCEVPMLILMATILKKSPSDKTLIVSALAYTSRIIILAFAQSIVTVYMAVALNFFCVGIYSVSSVKFAKLVSADDEKARAQSLVALSGSSGVGMVVGSALSGILMDLVGTRPTFLISGGLCFTGLLVVIHVSTMFNASVKRGEIDPHAAD